MAARIRKGDLVEVIAGKEKGKRGKVLRMDRPKGRVFIEKVNLIKRHTKPTQRNPAGGIVEKEAGVHASNVLPVCAKCDAPRRVGHKASEAGRSVRICRKCSQPMEAAA